MKKWEAGWLAGWQIYCFDQYHRFPEFYVPLMSSFASEVFTPRLADGKPMSCTVTIPPTSNKSVVDPCHSMRVAEGRAYLGFACCGTSLLL